MGPAGLDRLHGPVVTYGENGGTIRTGLTTLLHQHRTQHRLSTRTGPVTNGTLKQREEHGAQIRRYRQGVLVWCHQATVAADPYLGANEFFDHNNSKRASGPYDLLRTGLERAIDASTAPLPPLDELSTPHEIKLVESWRQIAAAAAIGEHDFHAGLGHGMLNAAQSHTVMRDVAAIVQAMVILDHRYAATPGWEKLRNAGRLGWSALAVALESSIGPPDYTVDHRGWRPPVKFIRGPARPGLLGVLQAEQNLLVRLTTHIAPINLRLAATAQMTLSADLATRTINVELQHRWTARMETYRQVIGALRDIAPGHAEHGASAAQEANNVIARVAALDDNAKPDNKMLAAFEKRFIAVDARISALIESGIRNNTILRRTKVSRVDTDNPSLIKPVRERLAPIEKYGDSDLLKLVSTRLRPAPEALEPPLEAGRSRAELYAAIVTEAPTRMHNGTPSRPATLDGTRPAP